MSFARPAYRVQTERLLLRCWDPADAPLVRDALDASNEHLRPWIPWMRDEPRSLEETVEWLRLRRAAFDRDEDHRYALFAADGSALVGEAMLLRRCGPRAREIGYWIDLRRTGRGYATEATAALVRVAFEVEGVERVLIQCAVENASSAAVPAKLGFVHEATLAACLEDSTGALRDGMVWSLFAHQARASPARSVAVAAFDALGRELRFCGDRRAEEGGSVSRAGASGRRRAPS